MAMRLNVASGSKRTELHRLNPFEVILQEDGRGRRDPPTKEEIVARALSMLEKGQLQAVECRRDNQQRPVVTYGYTRTAAARLIREGFTYKDEHSGEEKFYQDENFTIEIKVYDCNEQEAFERNVMENLERNITTPIDDALNQRRFKDRYGFSDAEIAKRYRYKNTNKVVKLRKLLTLDQSIQDKVHSGELTMSAALELCDLPEERRVEVLQRVEEQGPISGSAIRSEVREEILRDTLNPTPDNNGPTISGNEDEEGEGPEPAKSKPRSMREIRKFFEAMKEADEDPALSRFAKDTLSWLNGKKTDTAMNNAVERLLDARRKKRGAA